jgi:ActD protein
MRLAAEYASAADLLRATTFIGESGVQLVETFTPHPIDELSPPRRRPVVLLAAAAGCGAALAAYAGQWLLDAYLYPIDAGGRPPHMPFAFVPITIEMGFLAAAVTAFVLWFIGARLGTLWEPVCDVPGFSSAGYWVVVAGDDEVALRAFLGKTGAARIEAVPERGAA